jgi:hypothetical protein
MEALAIMVIIINKESNTLKDFFLMVRFLSS